ncbi:hypothetical protein PIB30_050208 [Stylosanthes scabra]|uniref:Uncharacterized protein n=1 Tax=Stylosanthes scabra TaxID=79078 RepID=A0ABU6VG21_9FABA|nr:hypothetical protein [Stylosanthes scabra]
MVRHRARLVARGGLDPNMACDGADRVKRQFGGEQPVPKAPLNLDGFLNATARGNDKWWPDELAYWYGFWRNRMSRYHQIQIMPTQHPGWPSREYTDWWAVACHQQFLTQDYLLQDPRGFQLPGDVPPAASKARDPIVLPRDAPARRRRARMQRPDIRPKGEGAPSSGWEDPQLGGDDEDEEAEYARQEDIPEGVGARIWGETAPLRTTRTSTSSQARMSTWLGSWSTAGDPGQDPGRNLGTGGHRRIVTACRVTCMSYSRAGRRRWIRSHTVMWRPAPPMMWFTSRAPLCSLTLTIPSRVRGFSTTSPRSSRSFTLHRSSSISCPRRIAKRITSHHRSRRILRLHGLSHITSPPSAITHRPRSPSTTIRRTRLSAHGHSSHRGIVIRPLRHIITSPPSSGTRGRPGLGSLVSVGCVRTPTFGVPLLSAQTAFLLGALNQVHLVPDMGGVGKALLLASHARVRPYCGAIPLRLQALNGRELRQVNTEDGEHAVYGVHILPPFDCRSGAAGKCVLARVVQRLEFPTVTGTLPKLDTE